MLRRMSPELAHRVISLRPGIWSLSGHSRRCPELPLANPVANDRIRILTVVGVDPPARLEIILPAVQPFGECRSSGLGRPHAPTATRVGPMRPRSRAAAAALSRPPLAPPPDGP